MIIRFPINNANLPVKADRDFPINQKISWHGGIHLDIASQNVYSIMAGTVCYVRDSSKNINSPPLNYRGATHNGCVLLRHELKLDADDSTSQIVTFYSLYMHLSTVESTILSMQGQQIDIGTVLGRSGMVDGQSGLHFQICCDFANMKKLVGRDTSKLDLTKNGRTDISYGDTHYYLPVGSYINKYYYNNSMAYYLPEYETIEPYYLIVNNKTVKMLTEREGKYQLVKEFPTTYSNNMLYIEYLGQAAYLNTNDSFIKKYTDADFPHWLGWTLINDDRDQNSQCNSPTVLAWLNDKTLNRAELTQRKQKAICNFPFEWDGATIQQRFNWLKTDPPEGMTAFTDNDMKKFEDHIKELCFFDQLAAPEQKALRLRVWHFEPRAFIEHINKLDVLKFPVFIYKTENWAPTRKIYEDTSADMALAHQECEDLKYKDMMEQEILALPYSSGIPIPRQVMQGTLNEARSSDASLWRHLEQEFFSLLSTTGGQYKTVVKEMLAKFKANTGGIYKHNLIDRACADHKTTREAIEKIKDIFSIILEKKNGKLTSNDFTQIEKEIKEGVKLPKFDDWDWLNGLGITIHDTWSTHIILESLEVDGNRFKAMVRFRIQDHFGLGTEDITPYKFNQIRGFRNWFVLQRWDKYGYKPFITEFGTSKFIEGTF